LTKHCEPAAQAQFNPQGLQPFSMKPPDFNRLRPQESRDPTAKIAKQQTIQFQFIFVFLQMLRSVPDKHREIPQDVAVHPFRKRVCGVVARSAAGEYLMNKSKIGALQNLKAKFLIRVEIRFIIERAG
jgi:hypothetical protein